MNAFYVKHSISKNSIELKIFGLLLSKCWAKGSIGAPAKCYWLSILCTLQEYYQNLMLSKT